MKKITILGATGSIGQQTVDVCLHHQDEFEVVAVSAGKNIKLLEETIKQIKPKVVCVIDEKDALYLQEKYKEIKCVYGPEGLDYIATIDEVDIVLNAIVGFASLLVESDDKKERQDYVDIMQENTELLLQLISDILDLSKIEAGTLDFTMDHLDIKSFCEDIMRNYDIKEDKPVPVLLAPDLPEYYIYTDKKRLMQVITNFINNALKFTNEGQIMLEYRHKAESNEIEFAVTDTGMGIAPDKVDQVFDRFVKLNSFSKGTGLGLSICRSIIEHLGGTIGAESEIGVGSRFWFTHRGMIFKVKHMVKVEEIQD